VTIRFDATPITAPPRIDLRQLADARAVTIDPHLGDAFLAQGKGTDRLDQLMSGGALAVTTGQQPGLLTGPLFTIYKALTAIAAAETFESVLGRPVVPVFWVAGDDHDLAESNHFHQLTPEQDVERVALADRRPEDPLVPLYREPLGDAIAEVLGRVTEATPETDFRKEVMAWVARHYRADADYAGAFAGAMAELLGRYGLVVLRPTHRAAKAAMRPHLLRALEQAGDLDRLLAQRARAMEGEGLAPPVPVGDGASLVMLEGSMGRDRLVVDGNAFVTRRAGERFGLSQLSVLADDEPERLSPNVLLRPAIEAAILPTLAYVAGPGELAYLPQCAPVYAALGVTPQVPIPRWSARAVESRVAKVLDKYDITPDDLARPEGSLEASLVRDDMPEEAQSALHALRIAVNEEYSRLERAATQIDPTLKKPVLAARNTALKDLGHVEKRLVSHLKNRNQIVISQIAKARAALYPGGQPQERVLNVVGFLIRYGTEFLDMALEAARVAVPPVEPNSDVT